MGFIKNIFAKKGPPDAKACESERALLIYNSVNDVIQAESLVKKSGFSDVRVVAPPPDHRTGCDLSLEIPLIEQIGILHVLHTQGLDPENVVPIDGLSIKPTELCSVKEFDRHIMIRAANMKLTFDKASREIVNISGGGCSDVPFLAHNMISKTLSDAPSPREAGYTLCAYTLAIAFEEARKRYQ